MLPTSTDEVLLQSTKGSLKLGIFQVPRVEDNPNPHHQRVHTFDTSRPGVIPISFSPLPLFGEPEAPDCVSSGKISSRTRHYVTCLEARKAIAIRVLSLDEAPFKFCVDAGGVNVASADTPGLQDYFVAPDQEWIFGVRVADGLVRQFQILGAVSRDFSLGTLVHGSSKPETNYIEIKTFTEIIKPKAPGESFDANQLPHIEEQENPVDMAPAEAKPSKNTLAASFSKTSINPSQSQVPDYAFETTISFNSSSWLAEPSTEAVTVELYKVVGRDDDEADAETEDKSDESETFNKNLLDSPVPLRHAVLSTLEPGNELTPRLSRSGKAQPARDPVQAEADRAYRAHRMHRMQAWIAEEEVRSHNASPEPSVVCEWNEEVWEPATHIVTPPEATPSHERWREGMSAEGIQQDREKETGPPLPARVTTAEPRTSNEDNGIPFASYTSPPTDIGDWEEPGTRKKRDKKDKKGKSRLYHELEAVSYRSQAVAAEIQGGIMVPDPQFGVGASGSGSRLPDTIGDEDLWAVPAKKSKKDKKVKRRLYHELETVSYRSQAVAAEIQGGTMVPDTQCSDVTHLPPSVPRTQEQTISTGGLIQQAIVKDTAPERWEEDPFQTVRIYIVDPEQFKTETGINISPSKNSTGNRGLLGTSPIVRDPTVLDQNLQSFAFLHQQMPGRDGNPTRNPIASPFSRPLHERNDSATAIASVAAHGQGQNPMEKSAVGQTRSKSELDAHVSRCGENNVVTKASKESDEGSTDRGAGVLPLKLRPLWKTICCCGLGL